MFRSIARHVIKTECLEKYHELVKIMVEETRKEDGCIRYEIIQQISDPRVHMFIEDWRDNEAMEKHFISDHFTKYVPQFPAMFDEPEEVIRYNIIF